MGWKENSGLLEYIGMMCGVKGGGWNTVGKYSGICGKPWVGWVINSGVGGMHLDVQNTCEISKNKSEIRGI